MQKLKAILMLSFCLIALGTQPAIPPSKGSSIVIIKVESKPMILLGKRCDNGHWSDFGGMFDMQDYDEQTKQWKADWAAAREGTEELSLILDDPHNIQQIMNQGNNGRIAIKQSHTFQTLLKLIHNARQLDASTFLIRAPQELAHLKNEQFKEHQRVFVEQAKNAKIKNVNEFLEMKAIDWVPLEPLLQTIKKSRPHARVIVEGKPLDKSFVRRIKTLILQGAFKPENT